jgi:hypothetical protein
MNLSESRDQLRAVVSIVMNHGVAFYVSRCFITIRYSKRIVLRVKCESVVSETDQPRGLVVRVSDS